MTRSRDVATQGGLVLLNTTTFSAQSTVSINNVFTSTYDNYRIIFDTSAASATSNITIRLRNAGADRTGTLYFNSSQGINYLGASVNFTSLANASEINVCYTGLGSQSKSSLDVFHPFDATQPTSILGNSNGTTGAGAPFGTRIGIMYQGNDSNDGFSIIPGAGNISGTIRIYGVRN